jgi:hypothetical protein
MRTTLRIGAALGLCMGMRAGGQTTAPQPSADELQKAAQAFGKSDWPEVLRRYTDMASRFPNHALARFRVGVAQLELGKLGEAEQNFREGERLGVSPGNAAYRLGQVFSEAGSIDSAVAQLLRSANSGLFVPAASLDGDAHLAKVRQSSRWAEVSGAFDRIARPCLYNDRHRELDFWVGDWDVRPTANPNAPPSRNTITLEYNGCIVHEHWQPAGGAGGGESFNLYDRSFNEWRQTWVDATGGQHDYHGKLEGKSMVYHGELPPPPGQAGRVHTRLTFFHISTDSVRQFAETSADGGKTWNVSYDLMYVRRKKP